MKWIARALTRWFMRFEPQKPQYLGDFDRMKKELRPCDVILVESPTFLGRIIQQITQSHWAHAALYLGKAEEISDEDFRQKILALPWVHPQTQIIIEGYMGQGTILNPIEYYRTYNLRVCRPRGLLNSDAQQVVRAALEHWGADYDIVQILDLARFLLPWSFIPKRWRSSLFSYQPGLQTKTVCSTMIAESFARVKFPILPLIKVNTIGKIEIFQRNPKLYTPKDFDLSPYFEILKFPYLRPIEMETYRDLPWNKEGFLANDLEVFDPFAGSQDAHNKSIQQALDRLQK